MRGGTWSGLTATRVHRPGLLVGGIFTMLVINIIGPAFPLLWAIVGSLCLLWFGLRNLQITGMIVMLIGLLMNVVPLLANGATPVSELALVSVGDLGADGLANIDGLRESTDTATTLAAFGDVIPVPIVNTVVSIGDLIMLVALADIVTNLSLRARRRANRDNDEASDDLEAETKHETTIDLITIESPLSRSVKNRPAHAAHRRPRRKAAPSTHVPAHAKSSADVFGLAPAVPDEFETFEPPATRDPDKTDEGIVDEAVIVLDGPKAYIELPTDEPSVDDASPTGSWADGDGFDQPDAETVDMPEAYELAAVAVDVPDTEIIVPDSTIALELDEPATEDEPVDDDLSNDDAVDSDTGEDTARLERIVVDTSEEPTEVAGPAAETVDAYDGPDRRPIIDLTTSPTDEQLQEFLRRRAEADAELRRRQNAPGPRRRGRAPKRSKVLDPRP